jgi:hypothetical protein
LKAVIEAAIVFIGSVIFMNAISKAFHHLFLSRFDQDQRYPLGEKAFF